MDKLHTRVVSALKDALSMPKDLIEDVAEALIEAEIVRTQECVDRLHEDNPQCEEYYSDLD